MSTTPNPGLYVLSRWTIIDGKVDDFRRVIDEMLVEINKRADDAFVIDYYLNADQTVSYGVEYYRTPRSYALAALLVEKWVEEFNKTYDSSDIWMCGDISDPVVTGVLKGWEHCDGTWLTGFHPHISDDVWDRIRPTPDPTLDSQANPGLYVLASWDVHPGQVPEFKRVVGKMLEAIHDWEGDAFALDYYLDQHETSYCIQYFKDSMAYARSAWLVKPWVEELRATYGASKIWILGDISEPQVQTVLEPWAGEYEHGEWFAGFRPRLE